MTYVQQISDDVEKIEREEDHKGERQLIVMKMKSLQHLTTC